MAHHHSHQHHAGPPEPDEAGLAAVLDLDAEVLHAHLAELTAWLKDLTGDAPVRRILDLGSGTGTGTFALLSRFADAEVVAVDQSPYLLRRLLGQAHERGLAQRVRTAEADLDAGWPDLDPADLVWAAASLHHLADPGRALREAYAALRPGGLLAVVELDGFPRFLPDDPVPGLEERLRAELSQRHAEQVPHLGSDWGPRLTGAGFTIEAERVFGIELRHPLPEPTGRYAQAVLDRMRGAVGDRLGADDRAALDVLIDSDGPEGLLRRTDLVVRAERSVWVARRPVHPAG
ncbi:SAM-dependent methyltransferase [Kitasatospora gansuensis]|uniref:SAM-dependent methyltransferase n=1 Tax=Kitasatospora gansuensis TaxID=258050 RepID=A0A7W7WFM0_9ACTN|nr:class I SAM-dependent methyltransferase [Kitasatospora gansuensis]MBB4944534.1 SAM-dependent methyltransferase [Kitasatospora gansuensis]